MWPGRKSNKRGVKKMKSGSGVERIRASPCEGIVSSEQDGVVVSVLYPLEYCRESLLLFCCSILSPLVSTMARSLAAGETSSPC